MIWYEEDVRKIEQEKNRLSYQPKTIFYGSSSIRLWPNLYEDFKEYQPINLGFGGSTLAACVWFFERVIKPFQPEHLVLYAGDNDLGDGRHPEEVFIFFQQMQEYVHQYFPGIFFTYISVKPSVARRNIGNQIMYTNKLIKEYIEQAGPGHFFVNVYDKMLDGAGNPNQSLFDSDGLHMNGKGYAIWKDTVLTHISLNVESSLTRL